MESHPTRETDGPKSYYRQRLAGLERELEKEQRLIRRISWLRGGTFLLGAAAVLAVWNEALPESIGYSLAGGCAAAFVLLVGQHERRIGRSSILDKRRKIQQIQLARIDRQWDRLSQTKIEVPAERAVEATDLNLFGKASLFQLMSRCHTPMGIRQLRDWILEPAMPDEIQQRQEAVQYLRDRLELLEELDLRGRLLSASEAGPQAFIEWAESPPWLSRSPILQNAVRCLTGLIGLSVLAWGSLLVFDHPVGANVCLYILLGLVIVSAVFNVLLVPKAHQIFAQVSSRTNDIRIYGELFRMIDQLPAGVRWLSRLRNSVWTTEGDPLTLLNRLDRIMSVANLRLSPLFGLFHIAIQLLTLVDFHTLARLEGWQQQHGAKVRQWFHAIGSLECMASLATLSHDHPSWTFPRFSGRDEAIYAKAAGHPLLGASSVVNDVEVGPPGKFVLVTGSNMSGKSTLLRTVGVNTVLAHMGAPVFASVWVTPPVIVQTSMRVQDSLEDGVSFFMAELQRLKQIVDRSVELRDGPFRLLFLLDEILQGTNSAERHIAVAHVISRLVSNGAIGMVSTHDLELATNEQIRGSCRTVHFREEIVSTPHGDEMRFDYKLRPGLAPSTNALKLLKMVGLHTE